MKQSHNRRREYFREKQSLRELPLTMAIKYRQQYRVRRHKKQSKLLHRDFIWTTCLLILDYSNLHLSSSGVHQAMWKLIRKLQIFQYLRVSVRGVLHLVVIRTISTYVSFKLVNAYVFSSWWVSFLRYCLHPPCNILIKHSPLPFAMLFLKK